MKYEALKIFGVAISLRLAFIVLGEWLDSFVTGPSYTDIDYHVFTDAASYVSDGMSPYERATYRYPPAIAVMLVPTKWYTSFGKVLFSVADAACCLELFFSGSFLGEQNSRIYAWLWAFNLPSINICTRGSADAITNYLVMLLVRSTVQSSQSASFKHLPFLGALFGMLVYLRIYPVIYGPAILIHLVAGALHNGGQHQLSKGFHAAVKFSVTAMSVIFLLGSISYYCYGEPYLQNAVLYHLSREDHRHNFSVHYLGVYLSYGTGQTYTSMVAQTMQTGAAWVGSVLGSAVGIQSNTVPLLGLPDWCITGLSQCVLFVPQLVLFALIVARYAVTNLPVCLLLQTMVLVAYNKVITAQYFSWYLCLVPFALPSLQYIPVRYAGAAVVLWLAALVHWLHQAYQLEFLGQNRFVAVWQASLVFHTAHVALIALVIVYAPRQMPVVK